MTNNRPFPNGTRYTPFASRIAKSSAEFSAAAEVTGIGLVRQVEKCKNAQARPTPPPELIFRRNKTRNTYFGKAVRFNATLPENLLLRIDDRVKNDHRYASRSGFLAAAALKELRCEQ
jgi:hypothetical protein